jgi:hypothetical protein
MTIFEAMREFMTDPRSQTMDYFDGLRHLSDMTGHMPFGFIWLDLQGKEYNEIDPKEVNYFGIEWIPGDPNIRKEDVITVLETLATILKNNQETRYNDE